MKITINGQAESFEKDQYSVSELLVAKSVKMPEMVSVELNGEILDRDVFGATVVKEGDQVEFLYFMGGGAFSLSFPGSLSFPYPLSFPRRRESRNTYFFHMHCFQQAIRHWIPASAGMTERTGMTEGMGMTENPGMTVGTGMTDLRGGQRGSECYDRRISTVEIRY